MTARKSEFSDLRVGARVTLRDWRGDSIGGTAFLSGNGEWLARTASGAVFPVLPRELIAVKDGAAATFARLQAGALVQIADWNGDLIKGVAHCSTNGTWTCRDAAGARWLIEPYRLAAIGEG